MDWCCWNAQASEKFQRMWKDEVGMLSPAMGLVGAKA